jgi:AraC-like DNA-binding protein
MLTGMINDGGFASVVIHPVSDLFSYDMDTIYELSRHRPEGFEFEVAARYLSLLRQYFRIYHHTNPEETVRHDTDMESFREMLAFIGEHHQEEITLDEIADIGRMSRSKCSRMFRRYLGKSPIEHVQKYRLEKSVFLLKNTDLQFSEIASVCGFNQQSYFNRLFVREYGVTPRQMRKEFKKSSGE